MTKKRVVLIIVIAVLLVSVICTGIIGYVMKISELETERANRTIEVSHNYSSSSIIDFFNKCSQEVDIITNAISSHTDNIFLSDTVKGQLYSDNKYLDTGYNYIVPNDDCSQLLNSYEMEYKVNFISIANKNGLITRYNETSDKRIFYDVSGSSYYKYAVDNKRTVIEYDYSKKYFDVDAIIMAKPIIRNDIVEGVIITSINVYELNNIIYTDYLEESITIAIASEKDGIIAKNIEDEKTKVILDKWKSNIAGKAELSSYRANGGVFYEIDNYYLGETIIASPAFDIENNRWYIVTLISYDSLRVYSNLYARQSIILVAMMVVIAVLFTVGVISIVVASFKEKVVLDKKQSVVMTKIKKYMFDINMRTHVLTFSDDAQKMLGIKKNTIKIDDLKKEGYMSEEEFRKAVKIFGNIRDSEEVSAEFTIMNKHVKVDIYHIISKSERIDSFMGVVEDITPIVMKQQMLEQKANTDGLTRLLNRETLISEVEKDILHDPATRKAMYVIDIDEFKQINDKYGHYIGDILLQKTALALKSVSSNKNIKIGRLGGDEFCIYYYGGPSNREIKEFGALLCNKLSLIAISDDVDYSISCSIGISLYPRNGMNFVELYQRADNALYIAKESIGSGFAFYNSEGYVDNSVDMSVEGDMGTLDSDLKPTNEDNFSLLLSQGAEGKEKLRKLLSEAVENNEFVCYKQPKINVKTGEITSEALSRWYNPTFGIISPSRFILLFERTNSIEVLDLYMLEFVFKEIDRRIKEGKTIGTISVNQSLQTITQPYYLNRVLDLLKHYDVPEGAIIIEITERDLFTSLRTIIKVVNNLHELGFKISIDDFGSGFTTLSILKDFEVDEIKIDKSFMTGDFKKASKAYIIIKEIIAMAHELNIQVVAEGVENLDQARYLIEMGIDYLQGYIISKPVTLSDFDAAREDGSYADVLDFLTCGQLKEIHDFESKSNKLLGNRKKKK